jgi:intracellular septation protein
MKFLTDFFPVLLFFAVFKLKGIFVATAVAIAASVVQIGWLLLKRRAIEPMMWAGLAIIGIFGGATLILHNESFVKLKPTMLYGILSIVLIGGQLVYKKNAMKGILGKQIALPEATWSKVNMSWGILFALLGGVNLYVAHAFSTDTWVNFKLFGIMGIIVIFSLAQSVVIGSQALRKQKDEA